MKNTYVWICDYCKREFNTEKQCNSHEKTCKKKHEKKDLSLYYLFGFAGLILSFFFIGKFISNGSNNSPIYPTSRPIPTIDKDPIIDCTWEHSSAIADCTAKRMRQSECNDSVCCGLGNGTSSPMSKVECARLQAELNSKKPVYVRQPIKIDIPKMPGPQNVSCNFDLSGNWVCRPSW